MMSVVSSDEEEEDEAAVLLVPVEVTVVPVHVWCEGALSIT